MAVESAADRAAFLDADEFGAAATYTPASGTPAALDGIFDDPQINANFNGVDVSDSRPTFFCRSTDLPAGAVGGDAGDRLTVQGTTYRVADLEPDGQGMTRVVLGKSELS